MKTVRINLRPGGGEAQRKQRLTLVSERVAKARFKWMQRMTSLKRILNEVHKRSIFFICNICNCVNYIVKGKGSESDILLIIILLF